MPIQIHVIAAKGGGWDIKQDGNTLAHYVRKHEAISAARMIGREAKAELIIHNLNRQIGKSESYGHDSAAWRG